MTNDQYNQINQKIATMSHYLETYSDVLQEQITELAKFANNLDKVSKQLQEVCHMLNGRNKVVDNTQESLPAPHLGP